jgi:mono/diheme cytochrome c family protein
MRIWHLLTLLPLLAVGGVSLAGQEAAVARGKYLVEEVAKCQDCHTPRNEKGEPDAAKWMQGGPLSFQPVHPVPGWRQVASDLTSTGRIWSRWGDDGFVKFMTTGLNPRGHAADAPMPAYKLTEEDARAVVAYLKSLK